MNRRDFLKSSAAVIAGLPVLKTKAGSLSTVGPADVYDRPLHTVYPLRGGNLSGPPPTDDELLAAFDQVPGGITAMIPFLLNVKNPSKYESMIKKVQAKGITIVPGVGGNPRNGHPINDPIYKNMASAVRPYTDYIRLENLRGFYNYTGGKPPIQDMIDYLTGTLGFKHIMMNPWPSDSTGDIVQFTNPEIDASFNQVQLDFNHTTYKVIRNPNNWLVNMIAINKILDYRPTCKIVVNYESPGQHGALYHMEKNHPGSSKRAMNFTANQCQNDANNLYWAPPFTHIYDPLDLKTWPWIAKRLGQMP
jgi:hypothetical protein